MLGTVCKSSFQEQKQQQTLSTVSTRERQVNRALSALYSITQSTRGGCACRCSVASSSSSATRRLGAFVTFYGQIVTKLLVSITPKSQAHLILAAQSVCVVSLVIQYSTGTFYYTISTDAAQYVSECFCYWKGNVLFSMSIQCAMY